MAFIDLHHLSRVFGRHCALDDVTLRLEPGRIGLLGPNGAGKSTLLKILLGLLPPTAGSGEVLGQALDVPTTGLNALNPLRGLRALGRALFGAGSALRRSIGYMPEADALVPGMTGARYVSLAGELYGMAPRQAQRRAHEVLTYLDLEEARYRKLEEYSTGMKQRIKLAQALVHDPPVLVLDEPTSGMDPAGRDRMLDLLLALGHDHGKAILLSTHLLGDVERVCETAVILHRGKILLHGPVEQLRARRHDRYRLQIEGTPDAFLEELRLEGVQVLHDNGRGELRVVVPPDWIARAFFALADNHGVLLRGLQPDDESLGELFHRVIEEADGRRQ